MILPSIFIATITVLWALTLAAWSSRFWWVLELTSNFRIQYAVLFLLCACGLLILHASTAWVLAALLGASANLWSTLALYAKRNAASPKHLRKPKRLRLFLINVNFRNRAYEQALAIIRKTEADVVAVIEVNRPWFAQLSTLQDAYPFRQGTVRVNGWGMMLLSRLPFEESRILDYRESGIPCVTARLLLNGKAVNLVLAHPFAPVSRRYANSRNRQLEALARIACFFDQPVVVLGDLNITPWSPHFKQMLRKAGLRDSREGHGLHPTWPSWNPLLGIPIDHCLVSPEVTVHHRRVGPHIGSDHYPVIVELSV